MQKPVCYARNFRRATARSPRLKVRRGSEDLVGREVLIGRRDLLTDVNYWRKRPQVWRPAESFPGLSPVSGSPALVWFTRRSPSRRVLLIPPFGQTSRLC